MATTPLLTSKLNSGPNRNTEHVRIAPSRGWVRIDFGELWRYRELFWFLAWRDVAIRYKQTGLGVAWAVLQPLLMTVAFTIFFGNLAGIASDGKPYFLFSLVAMAPWSLFETGLTQASNSLVTNANLIKKVYFPRLAVPVSSIFACLPDFLVALVLAVVMMAFWGLYPGLNAIWMPFFLILALAACLGASLWLAAMNVWYRDVKYITPFIIRFWLFASPVLYPSSTIPEKWRVAYALNPMATVIEGFRWSILGSDSRPSLGMILASLFSTAVVLTGGAYCFRRMEKSFADVV